VAKSNHQTDDSNLSDLNSILNNDKECIENLKINRFSKNNDEPDPDRYDLELDGSISFENLLKLKSQAIQVQIPFGMDLSLSNFSKYEYVADFSDPCERYEDVLKIKSGEITFYYRIKYHDITKIEGPIKEIHELMEPLMEKMKNDKQKREKERKKMKRQQKNKELLEWIHFKNELDARLRNLTVLKEKLENKMITPVTNQKDFDYALTLMHGASIDKK
jgi:hypothetical protein